MTDMEDIEDLEVELYKTIYPFSKKIGETLGETLRPRIRDISEEILFTLLEASRELTTPDEGFETVSPETVFITIPAGTNLFRTYPSKDEPIKGDIIFCNSSPLSNSQIRNPVSVNDSVAILRTTRDIRLINYIPISMLLGAQIKEGGNGRGLFSDCCEYPVVRNFCNRYGIDGIVLTDQADQYSFTENRYLPPELHVGTECRRKMNEIAIQDVFEKRAFMSFSITTVPSIIGAIYPEFILCIKNSDYPFVIDRMLPMALAYCNDSFLHQYTVPNLIPTNLSDNWFRIEGNLIYPTDELINRQYKLNNNKISETYVLPYLYDREQNIKVAYHFIELMIPLYLSGGKRKNQSKKKISNIKLKKKHIKLTKWKRYGKTLKKKFLK